MLMLLSVSLQFNYDNSYIEINKQIKTAMVFQERPSEEKNPIYDVQMKFGTEPFRSFGDRGRNYQRMNETNMIKVELRNAGNDHENNLGENDGEKVLVRRKRLVRKKSENNKKKKAKVKKKNKKKLNKKRKLKKLNKERISRVKKKRNVYTRNKAYTRKSSHERKTILPWMRRKDKRTEKDYIRKELKYKDKLMKKLGEEIVGKRNKQIVRDEIKKHRRYGNRKYHVGWEKVFHKYGKVFNWFGKYGTKYLVTKPTYGSTYDRRVTRIKGFIRNLPREPPNYLQKQYQQSPSETNKKSRANDHETEVPHSENKKESVIRKRTYKPRNRIKTKNGLHETDSENERMTKRSRTYKPRNINKNKDGLPETDRKKSEKSSENIRKVAKRTYKPRKRNKYREEEKLKKTKVNDFDKKDNKRKGRKIEPKTEYDGSLKVSKTRKPRRINKPKTKLKSTNEDEPSTNKPKRRYSRKTGYTKRTKVRSNKESPKTRKKRDTRNKTTRAKKKMKE